MKVLMIGGDKHVLEEGSPAHSRYLLQKKQVDELDVFVWPHVHSMRDIRRALKTTTYDVITAQDPFWRGLLAIRYARKIGARVNIQVHTDLKKQSFFRHVMAQVVLRHADSVRVVSYKLERQVGAMGVKAKVTVLPIYIELAPFRALIHTSHPRFHKTILWLGRFEKEKDPARALKVLREVRHAGIDVGLIMLGEGSLKAQLERDSRRLIPYIEFPGWKEVPPYVAMADVVVSTSKHESYGASMIEALAAGVPVVAPDVGVAKEAGAVVVSRDHLGKTVVEVLQTGKKGVLKLPLYGAEEWAHKWKESL